MKLATLLLLAVALQAQTLVIDAGSSTDQYFTCGINCYAFTNADLQRQSGVYKTLRSSNPGTSVTYDIPVIPGSTCAARLDLIEPRPAGSGPGQSAIGTRIFTATVNGVTSPPIDIFAAVGALKPYVLPLPPVAAPDGHLRINEVATAGNPVLSAPDISCTPPPPLSLKCVLPVSCVFDPINNQWVIQASAASIALLQCSGATGPSSDCTDLVYAGLQMPDGTTVKIVGVREDGFAPDSHWMPFSQVQGVLMNFAPVAQDAAKAMLAPLLTGPRQPIQ